MWKEIFKNLLGKPSEATDKPIKKLSSQLDIKLKQFTQEELDVVLIKIKSRKVASLNKNSSRSMEVEEI